MTDMNDRDPFPGGRRPSGDDLEMTLERAETLVARAQEVFETTVEVLQDAVRTLKADARQRREGCHQGCQSDEFGPECWPWTCRRKPVSQVARILAAELAARLDLAAARTEIGARLARLRDAAGGDGVS
jgi:hypothetical protein